ncbi:MAG: hypothetical protein OXT09_34215 [Myxococcales bacterium]|nr:hypothetical protein [Myxococcales bacterium]
MPESSSDQKSDLQNVAAAAGSEWATSVRDALEAEGRRPVGLWPGTLTEARTRAVRLIAHMQLPVGAGPEREQVARTLYDAARNSWLGWRERED